MNHSIILLQVILSELYTTGFQRSFSDEDDLTSIADSDVVYAFQAPPLHSREAPAPISGNHGRDRRPLLSPHYNCAIVSLPPSASRSLLDIHTHVSGGPDASHTLLPPERFANSEYTSAFLKMPKQQQNCKSHNISMRPPWLLAVTAHTRAGTFSAGVTRCRQVHPDWR